MSIFMMVTQTEEHVEFLKKQHEIYEKYQDEIYSHRRALSSGNSTEELFEDQSDPKFNPVENLESNELSGSKKWPIKRSEPILLNLETGSTSAGSPDPAQVKIHQEFKT